MPCSKSAYLLRDFVPVGLSNDDGLYPKRWLSLREVFQFSSQAVRGCGPCAAGRTLWTITAGIIVVIGVDETCETSTMKDVLAWRPADLTAVWQSTTTSSAVRRTTCTGQQYGNLQFTDNDRPEKKHSQQHIKREKNTYIHGPWSTMGQDILKKTYLYSFKLKQCTYMTLCEIVPLELCQIDLLL